MSNYTVAAIPTTYHDVRFRSRLEARWAAIFDELGWRWDYEPIDLNGWIPDFCVNDERVLIDVKPLPLEATAEDQEGTRRKMELAAPGETLLILAAEVSYTGECGWVRRRGASAWTVAIIERGRLFAAEIGEDGGPRYPADTEANAPITGYPTRVDLREAWRRGGNVTQWRAPQKTQYPVPTGVRLYLAGKIKASGWRHEIVPELRDAAFYGESSIDDLDLTLRCDHFIYVGPFFISCDHGCYHRQSAHGAMEGCGGNMWPGGREEQHHAIYNLNRARLQRADVVFAFIEDATAYGTLVEIGMAVQMGKLVALAFSDEIPRDVVDDLWLAQTAADILYFGDIKTCWGNFKKDFPPSILEG